MRKRTQREVDEEMQLLFSEMDDLVDKIEQAWNEFDRVYGPVQGTVRGEVQFVAAETPSMTEMLAKARGLDQRWHEIVLRIDHLRR